MSGSVRPADERDAEGICAIYAPNVHDSPISFETEPPTIGEIARRIREALVDRPWIVLEDEGGVLGYAYAAPHRGRLAYLWSVEVSVYVAEDARRGGVGQRLYQALFDLLRQQGYYNAYAGITLPNPASVGLHESLGFEAVGVYQKVGFKMGQWHDVGWWRLALQSDWGEPKSLVPFPRLRSKIDWSRY
jgi:L-amino acid N-acyltransferase YncA